MRDLPFPAGVETEVRLECDGVACPCHGVRFERNGVLFASPRRLEPMSDLILSIERHAVASPSRKMKIAGIVVGCRALADGCFEITVFVVPDCSACFAREFAFSAN